MFRRLKEAFFGKPEPARLREFVHPQLGTLVFNDEVGWWEVSVEAGGEKVGGGIAGNRTPDPSLIQHALDILNDYPRFKTMVADFLKAEAGEFRGYEQEIAHLEVEEICLCLTDRPNDGMIYFGGGNEHRLWRCDYVSRTPKGLGFDD